VCFKQTEIDNRIQDLIETYQDHFGELHYSLFSPVSDDNDNPNPTLSDMRQAIIESGVLPITHKDSLVGRTVPVTEFLGYYLKDDHRTGHCTIQGYEYAFFHPPYGISLDFTSALALFKKINVYLFGEVNDSNLKVVEWETDFSDFFINEWWDFCWTVWSNSKGWLVFIYGTATD
jgi:hypothetical protein